MIASLGLGCGLVVMVFACAWGFARKIDNYSIVDAVWAFGIGLLAALWLALGHGDGLKRMAAELLVFCWSFRLGHHLLRRIRKAHPEEDARYAVLRKKWRGHEGRSFFWFFQGQALSVALLALPFLFIAADRAAFGLWEIAGTLLAAGSILGEALADHQMTMFKRKSGDPREVCKEGLWRYSRHPNYFFESLIWIGFYVFASGSAHGWATIHAPAMILYLLLRVTGVPPTEAAAVARKGDAYREYQRTTSVFIPLPPRS